MREKIEKINNLAGIIGIAITILTIMASFVFELCSYTYESGRNSYFKIDNKFFNVNLDTNLMNVFAYGFISIVVLLTSYFIYKWSLTEDCKTCRKRKIIRVVLFPSLVIAFFIHQTEWVRTIITFIIYSVYGYFTVKIFGYGMYKMINENKPITKRDDINFIGILIILPLICWGLGWSEAFTQKKFDYITLGEEQYVVLDVYNEFYYTYFCKIEGEQMTIYSDDRIMFNMDNIKTQRGNFKVNVK